MENPFETQTKILKETASTIYLTDGTITDWIALRYIELYETGYDGVRTLDRISTTEFAKSDKQILLEQQRIKNPYKVEKDVAQLINSVNGTSLHNTILGVEPDRQEKEIGKWTISGGADRIEAHTVYDLKNTSTLEGKKLKRDLEMCPNYPDLSLEDLQAKFPTLFKFLFQLSNYKWLYELPTDVGYINFVFNNWTFMDKEILPSKVMEFKFHLAPFDKVINYITKRTLRLESYQKSGYLPDCPDSTLGISKSSTFKIVKYGKTRRVNGSKIYNTLDEASKAQSEFIGTEIKETKDNTSPILCLRWCDFNKEGICEQGQQIKLNFDNA